MKCYYHPDAEAVGVCKNCFKGLCSSCAAEVENGIACKDRCEEEVKIINRITQQDKTVYQKTGTIYAWGGIMVGLIGLLVLLFGMFWVENRFKFLFAGMGIVFILGAIYYYIAGKKFAGDEKKPEKPSG